MTQGQGEGKVKLHTMNLAAAGSPLTDMGFVCILLKIWWSIHNTFAFLDCSLMGFWSIPWCAGSGLMEDQWHLGPLHARLNVVLNHNKDL